MHTDADGSEREVDRLFFPKCNIDQGPTFRTLYSSLPNIQISQVKTAPQGLSWNTHHPATFFPILVAMLVFSGSGTLFTSTDQSDTYFLAVYTFYTF